MLLVLLTHAALMYFPYPADGLRQMQEWIQPATGVDLFFVISGYLIGLSFVGPFEAREHEGQRLARVAAYWVRRVYRLLPAACLWIGLTFAGSVVFADPALWLPPHAMFFKCMASLMSVRNFEESWAHSNFGYYWSLSVENQFYLALPVLLLVVKRRWRVPGLVALCVLNAAWRPGGEGWWLFRYDGLVYGLLLFEMERAGHAATLARCLPMGAAGRAGLVVGAGTVLVVAPLALIHFLPLAWTLVNWAGCVLVFSASQDLGMIMVPRGLRTAALWMGSRTYSLYLCHIPVWFAVIELMQRAGLGSERLVPLRFAAGLLCMALAADVTYRRVELPLQARGRERARAIQAMAAAS